jgi:tetratricopeptide (TPR) repeat protein
MEKRRIIELTLIILALAPVGRANAEEINSPPVVSNQSSRLAHARGQITRALSDNRAAEALPLSDSLCAQPSRLPSDLRYNGELKAALGNWQSAAASFEMARTLDPEDEQSMMRAVECHLAGQNFRDARLSADRSRGSLKDRLSIKKMDQLVRVASRGAIHSRASKTRLAGVAREQQ